MCYDLSNNTIVDKWNRVTFCRTRRFH